MKKYVLKRLLSLIPTIFIVSVVIFLLVLAGGCLLAMKAG